VDRQLLGENHESAKERKAHRRPSRSDRG
jgi:hypothetical protein